MMMPLMNFVSNLGVCGYLCAGRFLTLNGSITVGDIQAFTQYVRNFTQPITQIANIPNVLQQTAAAAERVFAFWMRRKNPDPHRRWTPAEIDAPVHFAHVHFGYVPEKTIINDFSLVIEAGHPGGHCGPHRRGQDHHGELLMRFYDVSSGAILLNGYDVRQFSRSELRDSFGMVLQDTWLYNGTIRENIRFGRLAPPTTRCWPRQRPPRWITLCAPCPRATTRC